MVTQYPSSGLPFSPLMVTNPRRFNRRKVMRGSTESSLADGTRIVSWKVRLSSFHLLFFVCFSGVLFFLSIVFFVIERTNIFFRLKNAPGKNRPHRFIQTVSNTESAPNLCFPKVFSTVLAPNSLASNESQAESGSLLMIADN